MAEDSSLTQTVRDSKMLAYAFGAVALITGVVLIFWPDATVEVVATIVGIFAIIGGIMLVAGSFAQRKASGLLFALMLLRGLVNVAFGALLVFWPGITVSVVIWLFGIMLIVTGVFALISAVAAPEGFDRGGLVAQGLVELGFGIVLVVWPDETVRIITRVIGIGLAVVGLSLIISGARLRERDFTA